MVGGAAMTLIAPTLQAFFTDYPEAVVIPMPALNGLRSAGVGFRLSGIIHRLSRNARRWSGG